MVLKTSFTDFLVKKPVFSAKLRPPLKINNTIRRQRLIDILHRNIDSSVQIISAPAGYGKTTLLVDFIYELDIPVCWYSLDESDSDPRIFIEGLSASVQSKYPDFDLRNDTFLMDAFNLEEYTKNIVDSFINEIIAKVSEYTLFVIEDYHFIANSNVLNRALDLLLNNIPDNCHFIISSRNSVELPSLSRFIIQRKANCLNISDISFSPIEVKELLTTYYGINLSDLDSEKIVSETDGWIVGIILNANKIQENTCIIDNSKLLSKENVFKFLLQEVYEKQPVEIQDFLMASSILSSLDLDICDSLLEMESSQKLLNNITKRQLFIQCIDSDKSIYRYHNIFREFLRHKLLQENPQHFKELHIKAAVIYEKAQQYIEAVQHFVSSREYDGIVRIINNTGEELIDAGKWTTLLNWINDIPRDLYISHPNIMMLHARCLIYAGDSHIAIGILNSLLEKLQCIDDRLFRARLISWRSAAYRLIGYLKEAESDIKTSISLFEKGEVPALDTGDAYRRLGEILLERGRYKESLNHLKHSLMYYNSTLNLNRISEVQNSIGIIYKYFGDLDTASMYFEKSRTGWQKVENDGALAMTLTNIAEIYHLRGEYEMAINALQFGLEKARKAGYRRIESYIQIHTAEVKNSQGLYKDAITACNQGLEIARQVMEVRCIAWAKADMAESYRFLGDLDKAEMLANEAISFADENGQHSDLAKFKIQIGIINYERGNYKEAIQILNNLFEYLNKTEDKYALAKTVLHLAQAFFMSREYDKAFLHLNNLVNLCKDLGYYDFIATEGRNCKSLLQWGIYKGIEDDNLNRIIEKINLCQYKVYKVCEQPYKYNGEVLSTSKPDIEIYALGEIKVINYGLISETQWRSNKAKELLLFLLYSNRGCTSEQISTALWPDLSPSKAIGNFHVNLYRARRAVLPNLIVLEEGKYKINRDLGIWFDVEEFENKLNIAFSHQCRSAMKSTSLERAIELYRGDFMDGFLSDWVLEYRRDLEDRYARALSVLANIKSENGEFDDAIELMVKAIRINQFNEEAYFKIIEWQIAKGDKTSAIGVYHRYLDQIVREMDISPSTKMENLYKSITRKEDSLKKRV